MLTLQLNSNYYSQVLSLIRNTDKNLNWSDKQIFECFDPNHIIYSIKGENKLIAVAIFSSILDTAELLYICVDKAFQNKKLANKLLADSIINLKTKSISELFLEVSVNNTHAIALYKKIGFKQISMRKNYYKYKDGSYNDALIYKLNI